MGIHGAAGNRGRRCTILVVDDDAGQRGVVADLLSARGYAVVPVLVTSAAARDAPPAGADACLEKPVDPEGFRAIVGRLSARAFGL